MSLKKRRLIVMSIITTLCSILGCNVKAEGFKSVGVEEFEQAMADSAAVCLDVRTAAEYADGHIAGAENVDVLLPDFTSKAVSLPKDKTVCLYCRSGNRSKKAAAILSKNGYTVVELDSGINGWTKAGKPTTK